MRARAFLSALFTAAIAGATFFAPGIAMGDIVGVTTVAKGETYLLRDNGYFALEPGVDIDEGDIIQTGPDGRAQLEMNDGSVLEVGESTELYLDEYQLQEDESVEAASLSLIAGFLRFVTAKVKSSSFYEVNTSTATIGIRGTEGVVEATEVLSNLLLEEGHVEVFEVNDAGELGASWLVQAGEAVTRERGRSLKRRDVQHLRKLLPKQFQKESKRYRKSLTRRGVLPKKLRAAGFKDLHGLLKSNPRMRKQFKQRFKSKLKDPTFRRKLKQQPGLQWLLDEKKDKGQKKTKKKQKKKKK